MRTQTEAGMSLFEVVLAAAILALVMLGVLASINGSFLAGRASTNATRSQAIARQTMEECLSTPYDALMGLHGNTSEIDGYVVSISVVQSSARTRLVEVAVAKSKEPGSQTRLLRLCAAR